MQKSDNSIFNSYSLVSLVLAGLLFIFGYTKDPIYMYATLVGAILFVFKPIVLFPVMFFSSLSTAIFSVEEGTSIGRYLSLIFIISCVIRLIYEKYKINYRNLSLFIALIIYCFFSTVSGKDGRIDPFVSMLINLAVFFLFKKIHDIDINNIIRILCFAALGGIIMMALMALKDSSVIMMSRFNMNEEVNANRIGIMMEQLGSLCLGYIFFDNKTYIKLLFSLGAVASVWIILMTGSRTALIALLSAIMICVLITVSTSNKNKKIGTFVSFFIVGLIGYLFVLYISGIDSPILERYTIADVAERGGTGRVDNAMILMTKILPSHLLFGSGMGGYNMLELGRQYGLTNLAHNIIIDPLTELGIVGFCLFLFIMIPATKIYFKMYKESRDYCSIVLVVLTAIVFNGIGEVVFFEKFFWNDLTLLFIAYNYFDRKNAYIKINNRFN